MKKNISAFILLAALLVSLTACNQGNESVTSSTTTGNGSSSTTTSGSVTTTTDDPSSAPSDGDDDPISDPSEDVDFPDEDIDLFIPYGNAIIDGAKDESWANAATVVLDIVKKDSPADTTLVKASAMWDENAIYFLFEITDEDIYQDGVLGDYNNDGIYLYICEDPYNPITNMAQYANGLYQFALINKELEMLPRRGDTLADTKAQSAYSMTDDGMLIEFCYTFTDGALEGHSILYLDYQYNDSGASGVRKGCLSWYCSIDGSGDPGLWGLARLLDEGETAPNLN
ncbi:MAG: sugar-binding protein [Eubacteriales bacterium]